MTDDESTTDRPHRTIDGRIDTLARGLAGTRGPNRPRPSSSQRPTGSLRDGMDAPKRVRSDGGRAQSEAQRGRGRGKPDSREDDRDESPGDADSRAESEDGESDADEQEADEADDEAESEDADESEAESETEDDDREAERNALEVELDPFVRALAARKADAEGESFDEFVVDAVKTYLASMLGGSVSTPRTVGAEHSLEVEADPVLDALFDDVAGDRSVEEVLIRAFADQYDISLETDSVSVAGLRAHEALLNGVVANASNDLDSRSEVVQAAVEARLGVAGEEEEDEA